LGGRKKVGYFKRPVVKDRWWERAGRRFLNAKPTQMANPKEFCSDEAARRLQQCTDGRLKYS
jgi:hypothetical protein